MQTMGFMPTVPSERVVELARALSIEYLRGVSDDAGPSSPPTSRFPPI
ncbi:MAG: hypothetical protein QM783_16575 [Phycisphaerales bacterium]